MEYMNARHLTSSPECHYYENSHESFGCEARAICEKKKLFSTHGNFFL